MTEIKTNILDLLAKGRMRKNAIKNRLPNGFKQREIKEAINELKNDGQIFFDGEYFCLKGALDETKTN